MSLIYLSIYIYIYIYICICICLDDIVLFYCVVMTCVCGALHGHEHGPLEAKAFDVH